MQINEIVRENPNKKSRQVGRGGTRGKTSGRGGKGQTARAGNKRRLREIYLPCNLLHLDIRQISRI